MNAKTRTLAALCLVCGAGMTAFAQDDAGFGFGAADSGESGATSAAAPTGGAKLSGEISAGTSAFFGDLAGERSRSAIDAGDLFSGVITLSVTGARADGYLSVEAANAGEGESPFEIDEAYARAYLGKAEIEAGLRKLVWGRADSQGPLDVINPQDQSDLTVLDEMERKIARPLVRLSYSPAPMTRVEAVFLPSFEGDTFAREGRWAPGPTTDFEREFMILLYQGATSTFPGGFTLVEDDTGDLGHWQAGLRLTTTFGSVDFGAQYYYGYLRRPTASIYYAPAWSVDITTGYNRYQQIGVDCATVLAGTNLRAELGANVTGDWSGKDGAVYNPSVVWSLGFDRDVVAGINLNVQGTGSIRVVNEGFSDRLFDVEAGTDITKTRITAVVSKKFFRDELELKTTALYGVEKRDYYVIPAVNWTRDDVAFDLACGFFGGPKMSEFGTFRNNDYLKASVTVSF